MRRKVGVLVSGRGSNLQALIDACADPAYPAGIALVISNVAGAYALERAAKAGIPTLVIPHGGFASREAFDAEMDNALRAAGIEIICLAGFMRLLSAGFVESWRDRMINIHPSLLPSFKGLHTHRRAIEAGVKLHGCTVHLVTPDLDDGPILVQSAVPVLAGDDENSLAARVLEQEHKAYPLALRLLAEDRVTVEGNRALIRDA
ncbi:phosphoribosylglycinamide formyltransferase [Magnetospirillum sp. SS-4]|uniref:phosphoribosylglycinamide formyltransferase n=1 Tax=Magnetospirillum sp. SS-4 TaxID=2681465 RepID=UPI00137EA009|nr:phosphoribosylglycinamide formyltransferase [Magnetospirillum sp. SS-4]CAA7613689.1 phosphoribosylglycinamide formyltransferase 1 [Magnetospirillum sp. SS-4]